MLLWKPKLQPNVNHMLNLLLIFGFWVLTVVWFGLILEGLWLRLMQGYDSRVMTLAVGDDSCRVLDLLQD